MYSMDGLSTAFGEITLVLFTTLAPSGVAALILMGLPFLLGRADERERVAIDRFMCIPIAVTLTGLVVSTTHLGNPANALYVLAGVGRSPLSNEVFAGVVFLGLAGMYWLTAFSERQRAGLRRAGLAVVCASGAAFVGAIAFAYDAATILTWSTPYVPLALCLNALAGGPLLALLSLHVAGHRAVRGRLGWALLGAAALFAAANACVYALQGLDLARLENHVTTAASQVPGYFVMLGAFAALVGAGIGVAASALRADVGARHATTVRLTAACVLALGGIFVMRFAFYMMHLTVGLGV
ncbi:MULTISPECIES: DmsC/YnfH family molybdoenzyme membrane anchor subunit [unclassified Adlercreutzia]|uniref:dimethyl sulfoxide reductase anchor subunit family protein n=1 Tax=unclassified Adlercreutzia TaxID=2636013 RepID=UPI001F149A32|nr:MULTISPECIES: DmsC/YnfH family molybdoenzyme membrane anchor subunit [unclassified Adlercreutzia]